LQTLLDGAGVLSPDLVFEGLTIMSEAEEY
jgi:hypothetical protein